MVIGDPIIQSVSPQVHNSAFEKMGLSQDFVFIAARVTKEHLSDFVKGVRAMGITGVSVTMPHKTEIMQYLDALDPKAQKIGAVNTVVNVDGLLTGFNTDADGAVLSLEKVTDLNQKRVFVLGAGGAARAVIFGLLQKDATVTVFNRSLDHAKSLAEEFHIDFRSLSQIDTKNADIIINATSVGLSPDTQSLLTKKDILSAHIVFDLIQHPKVTTLLKEAHDRGATIIPGSEMFLFQAMKQFALYTGHEIKEPVMREILNQYD
jgi:shikimate dehydrogenase